MSQRNFKSNDSPNSEKPTDIYNQSPNNHTSSINSLLDRYSKLGGDNTPPPPVQEHQSFDLQRQNCYRPSPPVQEHQSFELQRQNCYRPPVPSQSRVSESRTTYNEHATQMELKRRAIEAKLKGLNQSLPLSQEHSVPSMTENAPSPISQPPKGYGLLQPSSSQPNLNSVSQSETAKLASQLTGQTTNKIDMSERFNTALSNPFRRRKPVTVQLEELNNMMVPMIFDRNLGLNKIIELAPEENAEAIEICRYYGIDLKDMFTMNATNVLPRASVINGELAKTREVRMEQIGNASMRPATDWEKRFILARNEILALVTRNEGLKQFQGRG